MKACWTRSGWIAAAVVAALPAAAETFHNQDGVVFEGTLRKVVPQASVCNVLEEKYTPDEYERLKGNQGQPLDLWQVDFTVRNESGRAIEYLRASGWVRSEHPPCTNWFGEGPGRGPVLPEPSLPIPIYWTDNYEMLQMPYGMRPGQQVRRSFYLEVFHEHQPRFGEWDIDYTFAKESGAGRVGGESGQESGAAAVASGLPPEIQADLNLRKAEQALREGDAATARSALERLEALEREHELEKAPEDHYRYAQAWAAAGEPERAMAAAVRYLQVGGREAEHYTEVLDLINRDGALAAATGTGAAGVARVEPAEPQPGESRVFDGMEFVWVPAGEFRMGSTSSEADEGERPLTQVRISRGFYLGKHEVTQGQWQAVMGSNPSSWFDECGSDCPMGGVSWNDAQEFIGRLNAAMGDERYRLPTEAEWEYAARAGTSEDRYGDLDAIAWYRDNSGGHPHPVGQKVPNAWGLHDMLGNVEEWVGDRYGDYPGGSVTDPRGLGSGSSRAVRGGAWGGGLPGLAEGCRVSYRSGVSPGARGIILGFRLLRTE